MNEGMLRALVADNPWLDGAAIHDWYDRFLPSPFWQRRLELPLDLRKVQLVVGPRQAGKSTLIWKTLQQTRAPALHLSCEDPSIRQCLSSPALFLADLDKLGLEKEPLFFEEVQALDEAGLFLKGLVDRRIGRALFATGSSAFDLESQTRETLAGRAHRHLLLPFSLAEIPSDDGPGAARPILDRRKKRIQAERAAVYGGYPTVLAAERPEQELAELTEAFVLRDVSDRFRIRHLHGFRKIVQLAASQVGNLVNFSEWAGIAGVSNDTVSEYCRLLEDAHILRLVRPFVGGKRAELTQAPKVFFLDNGLRNQVYGGFQSLGERADRGALMENLVFTELAKVLNPLLDGLRHWRSKSGAEIDFVIEHQGRLAAVEVKAGKTGGRVSRAQRSFVDAYGPERLFMVGSDEHPPRDVGSTRIVFLGVEEIGPEVRRWLG